MRLARAAGYTQLEGVATLPRPVSNNNVWALNSRKCLSLGMSHEVLTARVVCVRKDVTWMTAKEWNEGCEFDEATTRITILLNVVGIILRCLSLVHSAGVGVGIVSLDGCAC